LEVKVGTCGYAVQPFLDITSVRLNKYFWDF
jgi:hypothetical protein